MTKAEIKAIIKDFDKILRPYWLFGNENTISQIKEYVPEYIECKVAPDYYGVEDGKVYLVSKEVSL